MVAAVNISKSASKFVLVTALVGDLETLFSATTDAVAKMVRTASTRHSTPPSIMRCGVVMAESLLDAQGRGLAAHVGEAPPFWRGEALSML